MLSIRSAMFNKSEV
jgi:hypothetical protein